MKFALLFYIFLFSLTLTNCKNNDDSCRWLYRCCKTNAQGWCEELCEAKIICKPETLTEATTQEIQTTIQPEESTSQENSVNSTDAHEVASPFQIILSQCRKGYRLQGKHCKKIA